MRQIGRKVSYGETIRHQELLSCGPTRFDPQCADCSRYNPSIPANRVQRPRMVEVIDATVLKWVDGVCPMKEVIQ